MTHKELLQAALPLVSLSRKQWDILKEHIQSISKEPELQKILEVLSVNQARIEVRSSYVFYNSEESLLPDESIEL